MINLKKSLDYILNRKNYKFIIFLLIGLIFIFLICGNYNLMEGLTLNAMTNKLNNKAYKTKDGLNKQNKIKDFYNKENNNREDILNRDLKGMTKEKNVVVEGFIEGLNKCSSNYSNLGLKGNAANEMVNSQCESLNQLRNKNKSLLN